MTMPKLFGRKLARDESGAAIIEMGLALPILVTMFFGLMQVGILYLAQASLSNAIGQAARFATIYPTPAPSEIEAYASGSNLGIDADKITRVETATGVDNGRDYIEIEMDYATPTNFIFFDGPSVTITATRRAYTYSPSEEP